MSKFEILRLVIAREPSFHKTFNSNEPNNDADADGDDRRHHPSA